RRYFHWPEPSLAYGCPPAGLLSPHWRRRWARVINDRPSLSIDWQTRRANAAWRRRTNGSILRWMENRKHEDASHDHGAVKTPSRRDRRRRIRRARDRVPARRRAGRDHDGGPPQPPFVSAAV